MTEEQELMIDELLDHQEELYPNELDFVGNLPNFRTISEKQAEWLKKIYDKVIG
ncbi:MAG: hypothetical protein WC940_03120 [Candidatus Paceibacterota bacterium]|jgi:hypothetical protein